MKINKSKKLCENCQPYPQCPGDGYDSTECGKWKRNPDLWLEILPEIKGPYWWRKNDKPIIFFVEKYGSNEAGVRDSQGNWKSVSELGGEWQGPITPHPEEIK